MSSIPAPIRQAIPYAANVYPLLPIEKERDLRDVNAWLERFTPEFFTKSEKEDSKENKELEAYYKYDVKRLRKENNHLRDAYGEIPEITIDYRIWEISFRTLITQAREISLQR